MTSAADILASGTGWRLVPVDGGPPIATSITPAESAELATMRLVRADVMIADEGVSTMQLTLNPPPGNPSPPGYE